MTQYVGLDVSLKMTALCVVDETGSVTAEGKVASEPGALARWLQEHAPMARRIGMETGPLAVWLWNELKGRRLPVHVIDARHAKAGLALQASKTDRNDARGLAQIMRTGWFREVRIKSTAAHLLRALASRGMLVATRCALENQIRGVLKTFGLRRTSSNGVMSRPRRGSAASRSCRWTSKRPRPTLPSTTTPWSVGS
jgi:transposase